MRTTPPGVAECGDDGARIGTGVDVSDATGSVVDGFWIEDEETVALVARLAARKGVSQLEAVRLAVQAEHDRTEGAPLRERLEQFCADHPMPPPTGLVADKAFFDELSGDL